MKIRTRKFIELSLAVGFSIAVLAGCKTNHKEENGLQEENNKAKEITLIASQNWIKDIDNQLFREYEQETGTQVKVLLAPDNEYKTFLETILSGGSDTADMFMYHAGSEMKSAGITEIAVDLSQETWVDNMEEWAVKANTSDGKLYGFSTWGMDYEGIIYNKNYFRENNLQVPTTWEEFIALCDQIKALGVTPLYEGINGTWHTQSWVYAMTPVMYKENPEFVSYLNEKTENEFADLNCFKEGMNQIQQLLSTKENGVPKYYRNDGQAEGWFGGYEELKNRKVVMMFTYSAYPAELKAQGATDEFGMFPAPILDNCTAVSNGGGVSKYINRNSKNIEECKKFLEFLAEDENLERYYDARMDLVTATFKNVENVHETEATREILQRTEGEPVTAFIKDVLHWDPEVYKYLQGMAEGRTTVDEFIQNIDDYRQVMFDTEE